MVSCVTMWTTPLATCSKSRGQLYIVSILHCSSCRNVFAAKVCSACWGTLAGAWDIKLILLRQGDLLDYGGVASSSSLASQSSKGKSSSLGASVSSPSSSSCVIGIDLLLFVPTVLGCRAPSDHMHRCCSIACVSASAVACSRKSLLSVFMDNFSVAVVCYFAFICWRFGAWSSKKCWYGLLARVTRWRLIVRRMSGCVGSADVEGASSTLGSCGCCAKGFSICQSTVVLYLHVRVNL